VLVAGWVGVGGGLHRLHSQHRIRPASTSLEKAGSDRHRAASLYRARAVSELLYEKVGFLENRCNTVKKADTVAQPLRERFQKLKTVVTCNYVCNTIENAETVFQRPHFFI
jgi:hypothetical protein